MIARDHQWQLEDLLGRADEIYRSQVQIEEDVLQLWLDSGKEHRR